MPKVTRKLPGLLICFIMVSLSGVAQSSSPPGDAGQIGPGEKLYNQLRTVGLDRSRVYTIRDASVDRAALHISLNDGTIAFTEDVAGRITGAYFEGDGEVLLIPPDQAERSSMVLFTGAAILEEKFVNAYLRFNDDTFRQLQPFLTPRKNSEDFIVRWNDRARDLAQADALRILTTFSRLLPVNKSGESAAGAIDPTDRMLHLKVQGRTLGFFDLFYDLTASEQISAGRLQRLNGDDYYDVWTSFAIKKEPAREATAEMAGGEEDSGGIKILSYTINAAIDLPTQLDAEARLHMTVLRGGARTVLFALSRYLKIRQVEADGHPLEFIHNQALEGRQLARHGDDVVAVIFPEPLRAGQHIEMHFLYAGAVLSDAGGGLLYVGARGTWYPNRGFDKATFDMEFRYPGGWTLVATGTKQDESSAKARASFGKTAATTGTQISRWLSDRPIPIAGFNLGKYTRVTKRAGAIEVQVYAAGSMERSFPEPKKEEILPVPPVYRGPPPVLLEPVPVSPAGNAQAVAQDAVHAISFYSARFGPYPYHELDVTQMPGALSQGWPGLIFLSSFSFLSAHEKLDLHMNTLQKTMSDEVIDHETAHQWWGDSVMWSGYRDQWISEGLANYSALLLLESENPAQFRAILAKYRDDLLQKNKDGMRLMDAGPVTLGTRLSSSKSPDGYDTIAYERGTWLFHMLRTMMSQNTTGIRKTPDQPFLTALRTLSEQYQTKPVSTRELMRIFEKELPASCWFEGRKSLDWFYQGWVNGTAIPALELRDLKYSDKPGATTVTGIIEQKDAPDSLITSVPIYASVAKRNIPLGRVFADGAATEFRFTAPAGTRKLTLDPDQTVLSRVH